ncbi:hypothetical protein QZH41_000188 [Actinostola sp. cb2023]|nr:hypothetical protein QZH41_000188 [Actinostola sp. cb2023]
MAAITRAAWFSAVCQGNESELRQLIDAGADINVTNNDGYTALMLAAENGKDEVVRTLIDAGADVNVTNKYGNTALVLAAINGKEEVARVLIVAGADVNVTDNDGDTALVLAAINGKEEVARVLIVAGADVNVTNNYGDTALMLAAMNGKDEVVRALIDGVADVNVTDNDGYTALMAAARYRKDEVPRALIDAGADVNVTTNVGYTALMLAAMNDKDKVVRALIDAGADVNVTDNDGYTALMLAARNGKEEVARVLIVASADVNVTNNYGDTALMLAARYGKDKVVRALIDAGADVNVTDNEGYTALMLVAENGKEEFARALIDVGADVNVRNNVGYTALMLAARYGKEEVARALMKAGADITVTNNVGYTALMLAAENGKKEFARALIDVGANINVPNNYGDTALILAAEKGKKEVAGALIEAGADFDVTNNLGYTALMLAARNGKEEVARALIDAGADVNVTNNDGYTALMLAARNGKEEVARALIDAGADVNVTNNDGYTALMLAARNGKEEVARVLIDADADVVATDLEGQTAIFVAAKYGREAVTRVLIDDGKALINAKDAYELHDRETSDAPDLESDSESESESIDDEEESTMNEPRHDHSKDHSASSSVHWEIAKQLRLYGADGKSCEDIASSYPELNGLLTNEIDINDVPTIIPWTSYSTTHNVKLAEVARRRKYDTVGTYWYHKHPIGSGSFGHVFAGINEKDGREVAIKKIDKSRMNRSEDKREISNLTALADCQQVVRYIFFEDSDRSFAFIVLELMEGHLDDYLMNVSFDHDALESTPLCKDVVMGLKYLHEHKPKSILHRDLKPGNILYKTHPKLCFKIADFGLSSPIDGASKTTVLGTNVGTRCWIAPEVIRSTNHQHSMSSDVFACGLILHYILSSQKHPFNPADCKDKHGKEKSAILIDHEIQQNMLNNNMEGWNNCLSPEATHLVKQMLDETQRPSAADALNHPMFWSNKKKMDFLSAVGNQQEIKCPVIGHLNAVETDLEATFPTIVKHTTWNDAMYTHMPDIHYDMTQPIVKTGKKGKLYTVSPKKYNTGSVVELIRFIRNAIAHASDASRPSLFSKQILEDCVFLDEFPSLVLVVFKAFFANVSCICSGSIVTFMAIDRTVSLYKPFFYKTAASPSLARAICITIFIFCVAIACLPFMGLGNYTLNRNGSYICHFDWYSTSSNDKNFILILGVIASLVILVMLVSNVIVFTLVWKLKHKVCRIVPSELINRTSQRKCMAAKKEQQMAEFVATVSLIFLLTWLPLTVRLFCNYFEVLPNQDADSVATKLAAGGFIANPFTYVIFRNIFKRTLKRSDSAFSTLVENAESTTP